MKKIGFILFILLFCFSLFPSIHSSLAVQDITVTVQPRRINTKAGYKVHLKLEKALEVHDWIKIIWPKGTSLPELPENKTQRNAELKRIVESIYIGTSPCSACQGLPVIDYRENSIRFNIHLELDPKNEGYEYVYIHVTDRVGITNPTKPGTYNLKIQTQRESGTYTSHPYEIVDSNIGDPEGTPVVEVNPPGINNQAQYKVTFKTGTGGELFMNRSRIRIAFPPETTLTKNNRDIPISSIRVNGKAIGQQPMIQNTTITVLSPLYVGNSQEVSIVFDKTVGIINPSKPGTYRVYASSSEDPDPVASNEYSIIKQKPDLEIIPSTTNKIASFSFSFVANSVISTQKPIYIQFPESVSMPKYIKEEAILLNNGSPLSTSVRQSLLIINPENSYPEGTVITVRILQTAGIKTPMESGLISLSYRWSDQQEWENTKEVLISPPELQFLLAQVNPLNANANASFLFTLVNGALPIEPSQPITLIFPEKTSIPESIFSEHCLLNKEPCSVTRISKHTIEISSPILVNPEQPFEISLLKEASIKNPPEGDFMIQYSISLPGTTSSVSCPEIYLYPPIPEAIVQLLQGKKGDNGWYTTPPMLSFEANQENSEIYFWFDEEPEEQQYSVPMTLEMGQYVTTLHYYSQNSYEKGMVQDTIIKIDTVPPELVIDEPSQPIIYTKEPSIQIAGRIIQQGFDSPEASKYSMDIKHLFINQKTIPFTQNPDTNQFEFQHSFLLEEGENQINIKALDEAGNQTQKEYTVHKDTIPPVVTISFPTPTNPAMKKSFDVQGSTEPFTELYFNGELVFVDSSGQFTYPLRVDSVGVITINAKAIDKSGNSTTTNLHIWAGVTIVLQIGNKTAFSNKQEQILNASPYINNGRTMVPFRYIGEALNATIGFEVNPLTKLVDQVRYEKDNVKIVLRINQSTAYINSTPIELDSPPVIMEGRTMVPLRFIGEALGCSIDWNAQDQTIMVTYPVW